MRKIFFLLTIAALAACSTDDFAPAIERSGLVLTLTDDASVVTRSTPEELGAPLAADFHLRVERTRTGRVMYDDRFTDFVTLPDGEYTLTATYGEDVALGVDCPFYTGTATAAITVEETTPSVTIPCRVGNALVSVRYLDRDGNVSTSRFDGFFSEYRVEVSRGNLSVDLFGTDQSAYFKAGATPTLTFFGTIADTGREVTFDIASDDIPATLDAADHLILTLSLQVSPSGVVLDVHKAEVETATIDDTIPLEWLPAPKVTGFDGSQTLYKVDGDQAEDIAVLGIKLSHLLQDIEMQLDFADENLTAINGTYKLSEMGDDELQQLSESGITLPTIGSNSNGINFAGVLSRMMTLDGETLAHSVKVRVKANNRWSSEEPEEFFIHAIRPTFNMPKQAPGYAWAHSIHVAQLTAADITDAKGADPEYIAQRMNAIMQYDISTDGDNWAEITDKEDGMPYAAGLESATTYHLRAHIGTLAYSQTTEQTITEAETPVPNGDFEALHEAINISKMNMGGEYQISFSFFKYYYQNTVTFLISEPDGWATLNSLTCNYDGAANKNSWFVVPSTFNTNCTASMYQSYGAGASGTTHTTADHFANKSAQNGDNAMVLQNVAWSLNGNTPAKAPNSGGMTNGPFYCSNTPQGVNYTRTAGELFLHDAAGEGYAFGTRPTALNFYYNYYNLKDANEHGVVRIEMLADDNTVIGQGSAKMAAAGSFTAVSVPIEYSRPYHKASRLRIKFASSDASDIKTEDVTEFEQCSYGATLTIDNLTFTYDK